MPAQPAHDLIARFMLKGTKPFSLAFPRPWGPRTQATGLWQLNTFAAWADRQGLDLLDVDEEDLDTFVAALAQRVGPDGRTPTPWSPSALQGEVQALRRFYAWLAATNRVAVDPAARLKSGVRVEEGKRQRSVAPDEHRAMVAALPVRAKGDRGLLAKRSAAILEVLWSTGVRRSEVRALDRADYTGATQVLLVTSAKGGPDRKGLLTDEADEALDVYLSARKLDGDLALFVTHDHRPRRRLGLEAIGATVRDAAALAKLGRNVGVHEYRRAFFIAHFREGGTDGDARALGGWSAVSRQPNHYSREGRQDTALENLRRRRDAAAAEGRRARRGA